MNPLTLLLSFDYRNVQICNVRISTKRNWSNVKFKHNLHKMSLFLFQLQGHTKQNALRCAIDE